MEAYSLLLIAGAIVLILVWGLIGQRAAERRAAEAARARAEAEAAAAQPEPERRLPREMRIGG